MTREIVLTQAIKKSYGNFFIPIQDNSSDWSEFTPYLNKRNNHVQYFKLIQYPSEYQTSEQLCQKARKHSHGLLHQVKFFEVSRSITHRYYILRSQSNVMSLRSFCNLKKGSLQKIKPIQIVKIIEFLALILKSKSFKGRTINLDTIGQDHFGEFKSIHYTQYFVPEQINQISVRHQIRDLLSQLLTFVGGCKDSASLEQDYEKNFGKSISLMIYALAQCNDDTLVDEAVSSARASLTQDNDTTMTESMVQHDYTALQNQIFQHSSFDTSAISDLRINLLQHQKAVKNKKKVCLIAIILFAIIILGVGLFVYWKYLQPRPAICQLGEYVTDQNSCKPCSQGCLKCSSGGQEECSICKQSMFLIVKNYDNQNGRCSKDCKGTLIRGNICIDPKGI